VCLLLLLSATDWYGRFTGAHGPFGFFGILFGVAAVGLTLIWYGRPGWRRATLYGIPSYVLIVSALLMLPMIISVTVAMIVLVIAVMALQRGVSLKQGHQSSAQTGLDDDAA